MRPGRAAALLVLGEPRNLYRSFTRFGQSADPRVRLHDARHGTATLPLTPGVRLLPPVIGRQ
ncbi:hypothetical protein [Streptomyces sp. ISL-100]|uniref:hypothetical protein n=1 Tax=Streptomyces sp. ISL-100 TaxID=2819173 RepID=UPI001BE68C3F|nr:hypothetical protein [Streptomyces sp. ISL-100]MBT2398624.1 hypothetical protein [Streptomyces sp. ISL-100]